MAGDRECVIDNHSSSLIFLYRERFQQWVRRRTGSPHQSMRADFTVTEKHHARMCIGETSVQAKDDAAVLHSSLRISGERFAQLRQDAIARVHHDDIQFL